MTVAIPAFWLAGWTAPDTVAPNVNITVPPDRAVISDETGFTTVTLGFAVDEPYQAYEIRVVTNDTDDRLSGTLIESGTGGPANTTRTIDVTYSEWIAAAVAVGTKRFKIFAQDSAGNWSINA